MIMSNTVCLKTYSPPPFNETEILRYAGVGGKLPQIDQLLKECLGEAENTLTYNVCYSELPVNLAGDLISLGFAKVRSKSLSINLNGCDRIVLFAATVGIGIDRLIARYGRISPTKALLFQAIGAERIESLCCAFNSDITEKYRLSSMFTKPRFSPGYGDMPLEFQRDIFRVLDCPRKLGLTLTDSLLMSPSKSVTAIIGVGREECSAPVGCSLCGKKDCVYRRNV